MKIAFLNIYQDKVNRGAETYVNEVSKRLSKNFEVDVISSINYFKLLTAGYKIIVPTNGRMQVLIVRLITWVTGAKMAVSGQSGPGADDKWNLLCLPDVFIGISKYAAKWAKRFNPRVRAEYIPNGVDLKKFSSGVKPAKIKLPRPIILNVGALVPGKNQEKIIKAVSKLKRGSLLLVGKGAEEKRLLELGGELLPGRFKILSFPHNDMPSVYPAADVFTYPTVPWESFGIVMVEAMASGLAVVATDDPIRREIVGDAGLFVDPTDIDKYTEMLERALKTKWGNKPRKQAGKFSWDDIAEKYYALFKEITDS